MVPRQVSAAVGQRRKMLRRHSHNLKIRRQIACCKLSQHEDADGVSRFGGRGRGRVARIGTSGAEALCKAAGVDPTMRAGALGVGRDILAHASHKISMAQMFR